MSIKSLFMPLASAVLLAGAGQAQASLVVSTSVPVTICDTCTVTSTIDVDSHFTLGDVNVQITSLVHTFDGDLIIQIVSPTGTSVSLSSRHGGGGDNYTNTVFDDAALQAIASGSAPFTGTFRPDELLSAFNGQDAFGTWTLRIADQAALDSGRLNSWGMELTEANLPEPASLGLAGLALAALGWTRRRRQA